MRKYNKTLNNILRQLKRYFNDHQCKSIEFPLKQFSEQTEIAGIKIGGFKVETASPNRL